MRRINKKFDELFILRPKRFFRFGVERIIFRDIQLETIPMTYILYQNVHDRLSEIFPHSYMVFTNSVGCHIFE